MAVALDPYQNIVNVGWGGPFLLVTGGLQANAGGPENGIVFVIQEVTPLRFSGLHTLQPDIEPSFEVSLEPGITFFGAELYESIALGTNDNNIGFWSFFYDVSKAFNALGRSSQAYLLELRLISGTIEDGANGIARASLYTNGTRALLESYRAALASGDILQGIASPSAMVDALDIAGGVLAAQPNSAPPVPLSSDAVIVFDGADNTTRAEWRYDWANRNIPPFSPPDFDGT